MRSDGFAAELIRALVIFLAGGFIYGAIELIYRGHTHPSMFVLGGICLLWVGGIGRFFPRPVPLWVQVLVGGAFITCAEFVCGLVYNVWLGMKVWDYSKLPGNIMGQICPTFFFSWVAISLPAVLVEGVFRSALTRSNES
ncbi:MAG: hypothetical protein IK093_12765 [Ruminiclostridium sp.]|nr:hypothetical protein [Ruminiclostridium sp.]